MNSVRRRTRVDYVTERPPSEPPTRPLGEKREVVAREAAKSRSTQSLIRPFSERAYDKYAEFRAVSPTDRGA